MLVRPIPKNCYFVLLHVVGQPHRIRKMYQIKTCPIESYNIETKHEKTCFSCKTNLQEKMLFYHSDYEVKQSFYLIVKNKI